MGTYDWEEFHNYENKQPPKFKDIPVKTLIRFTDKAMLFEDNVGQLWFPRKLIRCLTTTNIKTYDWVKIKYVEEI